MVKPRGIHIPGENRLLAGLPRDEFDRVRPRLAKVSLAMKDVLHETNRPIAQVYFPLNGVVSLVLIREGGMAVEVATIGNEGMVGTPVFLGADRSPLRSITQVPGEALRMEVAAFVTETRRVGTLHDLIQRYIQAMINQIAQATVCNHLHSVEQRMCRWLLMTHDRVGVDEFPLTQGFLAEMLGVRRPTVTAVAGTLQRAGLINPQRGKMTVLDRKGLETASCECYRVVRQEFDRLLG